MAKRAILAATAILVGSFNPVLTTAAFAAVTLVDPVPDPSGPTQTTLDAMQAQCETLAAAHGSAWTGTLDESSITPTLVDGPNEKGTHSIDDAIDGTLVGVGFTPGSITIEGDPFRIGGSVNMFGLRIAHGGSFASSTYDFEGEFETTYSYAFNCNMKETVQTLNQGYYVVADNFHGQDEDAVRANCESFTGMANNDPRPPWWGDPNNDQAFCHFIETSPAGEEDQDRPDEAGTPIEETQTDTLTAHEDAGEGYTIEDDVLLGQAVICISPSKTGTKGVPGTWTKQNGYTGDKCTTAWFQVAPWGAGSQTSKGTYISVPGV